MIRHKSLPQLALGPDIPTQAREWRNSYAVRRWCRQYSLLSESDHYKWLVKIGTDPTIKMFSILMEHRPVGVCGLTSIDRVNQSAEFSLYIAPDEQRKGYGAKALTLLMFHGFDHQNLNRIWGESFQGNPAQSLFKKLGLRHEGWQNEAYFRDGQFIGANLWAITRKEFNELYRNRSGVSDERLSSDCEPYPSRGKSNDPESAPTIIRFPNTGNAYTEGGFENGSCVFGKAPDPFSERSGHSRKGADEKGSGQARIGSTEH